MEVYGSMQGRVNLKTYLFRETSGVVLKRPLHSRITRKVLPTTYLGEPLCWEFSNNEVNMLCQFNRTLQVYFVLLVR